MSFVYKTFDDSDIVSAGNVEVTTGLWTGDTGSLSTIFTSSAQVGVSGEFYYDLYQANPASSPSTAEIQFSVAYGHVSGSGSPTVVQRNTSTVPTKVTYAQYKNILLAPTTDLFTYGDDSTSEDIYVINIQRSRLRETLDPGNWQISLSGSNGVFTFVDDSDLTNAAVGNTTAKSVYNVRSGSLTSGVQSGSGYFGLVFPDSGVIVLKPSAIVSTVGFVAASENVVSSTAVPFAPYTGSLSGTNYQYQHEGLVRSISSSMAIGSPFIARSAENISSTHYFVRLGNREFNYSNNPTYYNQTTGVISQEAFRNKPTTYMTTIGLYNDRNELVAVAKVSKPVKKSTDKEALIRVRLDY